MQESKKASSPGPVCAENIPPLDPRLHHQLFHHCNSPVHIYKLLQDNKNDPVFKVCILMSLHALATQPLSQEIHSKT